MAEVVGKKHFYNKDGFRSFALIFDPPFSVTTASSPLDSFGILLPQPVTIRTQSNNTTILVIFFFMFFTFLLNINIIIAT